MKRKSEAGMGKKKFAANVLTRALDEAPVAQKIQIAGTASQRTEHARPLGEMLETLKLQTLGAMSDPFFDGGAAMEMTPVTKRMHSEMGTFEVKAKHRDPAIEASVTIDVRCDQDELGHTGLYQLRAKGRVTRGTECGDVKSEFPVSVRVREADGALTLGADEVRDGIAEAIRSTGAPRA